MAWGVFKKIKAGIQKAGNYLKTGLRKGLDVAKKVVNAGSKLLPAATLAANAIKPGSGKLIETGWNMVNNTVNGTVGNSISSWLGNG
jgi:electron transfer flavoprotein alpha/beta subunit